MRRLGVMVLSDLRQRIRDRSVLIFALVVPLALMFVFNLIFGGVTDLELDPVSVAVSAPADDPLARPLVAALSQVDGLDVTIKEVSAEEARAQARSGAAALGVVVPQGFGTAVTRGEGAVVDVTEGDGAGIEGDVLLSVARGVLDQLHAGAVAAAAGAEAGVAGARLSPSPSRRSTGPRTSTSSKVSRPTSSWVRRRRWWPARPACSCSSRWASACWG